MLFSSREFLGPTLWAFESEHFVRLQKKKNYESLPIPIPQGKGIKIQTLNKICSRNRSNSCISFIWFSAWKFSSKPILNKILLVINHTKPDRYLMMKSLLAVVLFFVVHPLLFLPNEDHMRSYLYSKLLTYKRKFWATFSKRKMPNFFSTWSIAHWIDS